MPSSGFNSGTQQSTGSGWNDSFSNQDSSNVQSSSSFSNSSGKSNSASGAAWSPDQLARINALYPTLLHDYLSYNNAVPFSNLLKQIGGTPTSFADVSPYPDITIGPIWNDQQIQGRVNASRAQNDLGTAGKARSLAESTAGRGFGNNSPLYQELVGNLYANNLAANTSAENDLRWNAAQGNAQQVLASQQAGVGRATALNTANLARSQAISEDEIRRRQLAVAARAQDQQLKAARQNALLQALGYYNQPLPFANASSSNQSQSGSFSYGLGSSTGQSGSTGGNTNQSTGSQYGENLMWEPDQNQNQWWA